MGLRGQLAPLGGSAALNGGTRGNTPHERRFFCNIARAYSILGSARLPPPMPTAPCKRMGGRRDRQLPPKG